MFKKKTKKLINEPDLDKLPILVLDEMWCSLFHYDIKNEKIIYHEHRLKNFLKLQKDFSEKLTELSNNKKKLLNKILELSHEAFSENNMTAKNQMEQAQNEIQEINGYIYEIQERLGNLPEEINNENILLYRESVDMAYGLMKDSREEIKRLAPLIYSLRRQLAENTELQSAHEDNLKRMNGFLLRFIGEKVFSEPDGADKERGNGFRHWYRHFRNRTH